MIEKDKVDERLSALGKDRKWLAEATGYTYFTLRDCLAPNGKSASDRMLSAISQAIGAEETRQVRAMETLLGQTLVIEADREQFRRWNSAALAEGELIEDWAIKGLDRMAKAAEVRLGEKADGEAA